MRRGALSVKPAAILLVLALSACSSAAPATFDLHAADSTARRMRGTLLVDMPLVLPPLNNDRLIVRTGDDSLAYLGGVQWADNLSPLLQSRMIESFQNANLLRNLRRYDQNADYRLVLTVRRFDLDAPTSIAHVDIAAQLIASSSGKVVAARIFTAEAPAAATTGAAPPLALDRALTDVQRQIVAWSAASV